MEKSEGYKICADLKPGECCFVVEQYEAGAFLQVEHLHAPESRLSSAARRSTLVCLVSRFWGKSGMSAEMIVACHLNRRGKAPPRYDLQWHTSYPEPGVVRQYCGGNTKAWFDVVVDALAFRSMIKEE